MKKISLNLDDQDLENIEYIKCNYDQNLILDVTTSIKLALKYFREKIKQNNS